MQDPWAIFVWGVTLIAPVPLALAAWELASLLAPWKNTWTNLLGLAVGFRLLGTCAIARLALAGSHIPSEWLDLLWDPAVNLFIAMMATLLTLSPWWTALWCCMAELVKREPPKARGQR